MILFVITKKDLHLDKFHESIKATFQLLKDFLISKGVKIRNPYDYTKSGYEKYVKDRYFNRFYSKTIFKIWVAPIYMVKSLISI